MPIFDRRSALTVGALGAGGLCLSDLLRIQTRMARSEDSSKDQAHSTKSENSAIILWMRGGPSQHETWDPKPDAPVEYRGAFGATTTNVSGIHLCDLLPLSAAIMDKWSIVRSLHHTDAGHSSADQVCFTGYPGGPNLPPNGPGNSYPSCGSIVADQLGHLHQELPPYVMIPRMIPGTGSGYLGPRCNPFETIADPASNGPFQVRNLSLERGLEVTRLSSRRELLSGLDRLRTSLDQHAQMDSMDEFQQQAWNLLTGPAAQEAFALDKEPDSIRQRYGFIEPYIAPTPDRCGVPAWSQRFVLARRLVEHGIRLVTVDCRWWDTHVKGYETMRDGFLPRWDQAYSALIEDLADRGLLESTMVIAWGEFGRTPRVNATGGRDHYPNVFSAALAGGPIQGGRVAGESDSKGALPANDPISPQDVLATLYDHLGIDANLTYSDHNGRPHPILPSGEPIHQLM